MERPELIGKYRGRVPLVKPSMDGQYDLDYTGMYYTVDQLCLNPRPTSGHADLEINLNLLIASGPTSHHPGFRPITGTT